MVVTAHDVTAPTVGSSVALLPVAAGPERIGTLSAWSAGPAGLVVTVGVSLPEEGVAALGGQRVWARVESEDGAVRVLEGVAVPETGTDLVMTGVLALAEERRRAAPRAETSLPARVSLEALALRHARDARTVDLSRTGARLRVPPAALEDAAALVEVEVAVGEEGTVTAGAEVIRVDAERGEVAVRFVDLDEQDAERLDRAVLSRLSARRGAAG